MKTKQMYGYDYQGSLYQNSFLGGSGVGAGLYWAYTVANIH